MRHRIQRIIAFKEPAPLRRVGIVLPRRFWLTDTSLDPIRQLETHCDYTGLFGRGVPCFTGWLMLESLTSFYMGHPRGAGSEGWRASPETDHTSEAIDEVIHALLY